MRSRKEAVYDVLLRSLRENKIYDTLFLVNDDTLIVQFPGSHVIIHLEQKEGKY